jgi:hypothetical protein
MALNEHFVPLGRVIRAGVEKDILRYVFSTPRIIQNE